MRKAGRILARFWKVASEEIRSGRTTAEIDRLAEDFIRGAGAEPAFKGYRGFPATVCASVNEEVVHGIPGKRVLREGDIVGIDVGVRYRGFYSDAARTYPVGPVDLLKRRLIEVARTALDKGIAEARTGNRVSDISHAIQSEVEENGFQVVRQYVGHGIGTRLHEDPQVPNFGRPHEGELLRPGMSLAIEPMVNAGGFQVEVDPDGWTVRTVDGKPSSHFEDTVLITEKGTEVLTRDA